MYIYIYIYIIDTLVQQNYILMILVCLKILGALVFLRSTLSIFNINLESDDELESDFDGDGIIDVIQCDFDGDGFWIKNYLILLGIISLVLPK